MNTGIQRQSSSLRSAPPMYKERERERNRNELIERNSTVPPRSQNPLPTCYYHTTAAPTLPNTPTPSPLLLINRFPSRYPYVTLGLFVQTGGSGCGRVWLRERRRAKKNSCQQSTSSSQPFWQGPRQLKQRLRTPKSPF